jgi:hypothetical protein
LKIGEIAPEAFDAAIAAEGIVLRTGPFTTRLRSGLPEVGPVVRTLYRDFSTTADVLVDYHFWVGPAGSWLRRLRRQIVCLLDDEPLLPIAPRSEVVAMLEWGLNACVYRHAHQYLVVHSGVVERSGSAILFPGDSGAGKSTLCAFLACRGWRLLSDELAIIRPSDGCILALARPVSLKNESIDIIRKIAPDAIFGPRVRTAAKGVIAHLRPPARSVARMDDPAQPKAVVFVVYAAGATAELQPFSKARSFYFLAHNSLNYEVRSSDGFRELARLIDQCDCYVLRYSALDDAFAVLEELV